MKSLRWLLFLAGPLLILCTALPLSGAESRPNVLIIHTDEHNFRTLGCYRERLPKDQAFVWGEGLAVQTPHIDSIAHAGAMCDRYYASSPVCTPSRASFLSGRYPQNTGADSNDHPMRDDVLTFAAVLQRAGYATGYAGKWHVDGPARPGWTPARKFGFDDNTYMFNRGHWKQLEDTAAGPQVRGGNNYKVAGADEKSFTTDFLADKAVEFIKAHKGKPFCFMLSIPDPHSPNTVRPPYDTLFEKMDFRQPASASMKDGGLPACAAPPLRPHMENMARYFGMVKCIDDNVGKLLAVLDNLGLRQRTIVVFTSDHGDMCGEHGRVNKGIPLDGSARIPFVISYPGRIKPGTVIHQALGTVDFKPTLLGLLGLPQDPKDEGRDASTILLTGRAPADWKNIVFSRHAGGQWLMATDGRYKFIVSDDSDPCLLDQEADPFETKNLFRDPTMRQTVRELGRALADYGRQYKDPHASNPAIRADLAWAADGIADYTAPKRSIKKRGAAESDID
jgi:arylsulfatase A-like enzyme